MDSSPRPMRRFSRWKTTKRTFVLGGNAYVTGNKDHKASDAKDDNSGTRNDKRAKIRHSPRSPHKEKSHSNPDLQTKESSLINVDFNCKVLIHNLPHPEKTGVVLSDSEQAQNDCLVSKSPQALTVLSPNVTTTTKDNQAVISPSKGHNIVPDNDGKSHPNSVRQTDQVDSGPKQDSNPNSVHIDKENSTVVVTAQLDRSSCSGSQTQTTLVPPDSVKPKIADESVSGSSLRRQSLRDRSLLQSSSVLRHKNYPFFAVSKKKRSTEKKGNKSVNIHKLVSSPLNTVIHEKRKGKESVEKGKIVSVENHRKTSKKSEKDKADGSVGDESHVNFREDQSRSLSFSKIQTAVKSSEKKSEDGDCVAQVMSVSQSVSRSNKRKNKDSEIETVVDTKEQKSRTKKQKQKGGEVDPHFALSVSSIQSTTSTSEIRKGASAHSKQEASITPSGPKSTKRKDKVSESQRLKAAKYTLTAITKTQMGKTNSKSNSERSVAKGKKNINTSHEISMHSSGAQSNASVTLNSSSRRTLRDRSALGTPQMQYPAKFMSAAMIKSLSEKAKRLLSIPGTKKIELKLSEEEIIGSKGNARESVALNDNIPRKKTTSKLKASTQTSVKPSSQGGLSNKLLQASVASLSSKEKFQSKVNHMKKNGSKFPKEPSSSPKLNRKADTKEASGYSSQGVSPDELSQVPSAPDFPEFELQMKMSRGSKTSRQPSSSPDLKKRGNYKRNAKGRRDFEKHKETSNRTEEIEEMRKKSNNFSRKSTAATKSRKPTQILSSENQRNSSVYTSAERLDGAFDDREQNTEVSVPTCYHNEDIVLNDTAVGSKKGFKRRRLFQDSFSQPPKITLRRELYESGRDILLWSEAGEARKGSSVTSIDVIFSDVIELEDVLKDSETEYLQQRVVGKVMGRMKRSLKSQISQLERVRELESQVKMSRDRCNKIRGDIKEHEDKQRGLDKKLKRRKELEQKTLHEWMKSLKSFMASSRKT